MIRSCAKGRQELANREGCRGIPMVIFLRQGNCCPWRVILRAEQFVWHNKEFPATFIHLKDQAVFLDQNFLEPHEVFFFHALPFDDMSHKVQQLSL